MMVAYSFKPRFVAPILAGTKSGTIRADGLRRHAVAGKQLQLYTGMRTKRCALIIIIQCLAAPAIALYFRGRARILILEQRYPCTAKLEDEPKVKLEAQS